MRLLWYGCSWVEGVKEDITPFPNLVSCSLHADFKNRGKICTSIDSMVEIFVEDFINGKVNKTDIVIFCATSCYRIDWANYFNFSRNDIEDNYNEQQKSWLLNFADDDINSFLAFKNLSLLYFMCKSMNIKCFFVNSFYPLKHQISNLIPPENWLLPFDQSCVNILEFLIIAPELIIDDTPDLLSNTWLKHKEKIEKYLIPNDNHPNQLGNETIANYLTTKLKAKL